MKKLPCCFLGVLISFLFVGCSEKRVVSENGTDKKLENVTQRFMELKEASKLDGLEKDDEISDFSVYNVTTELQKLPSFKEVVDSRKDCHDLYLVDVKFPKKRLAYLFCLEKSPPDYASTFLEMENKWVQLPKKN